MNWLASGKIASKALLRWVRAVRKALRPGSPNSYLLRSDQLSGLTVISQNPVQYVKMASALPGVWLAGRGQK